MLHPCAQLAGTRPQHRVVLSQAPSLWKPVFQVENEAPPWSTHTCSARPAMVGVLGAPLGQSFPVDGASESPGESESEVAQSCPTLCNPMECGQPGSSIHGVFQARTLEWVAISFSRGSSRPRNWTQVSHIAGRCFTIWASREALGKVLNMQVPRFCILRGFNSDLGCSPGVYEYRQWLWHK